MDKGAWSQADYGNRMERLVSYLGGRCVRCGSTADLEVDHIDPMTKAFNVSGNINRRWEVLAPEVHKCQLLCHDCHRVKTVAEGRAGGGWNRGLRSEAEHATPARYGQGCRCEPCRAAAASAKERPPPTKPYVSRSRDSIRHGSVSAYSYHRCRCDLCKEEHRIRQRKYRQSH